MFDNARWDRLVKIELFRDPSTGKEWSEETWHSAGGRSEHKTKTPRERIYERRK